MLNLRKGDTRRDSDDFSNTGTRFSLRFEKSTNRIPSGIKLNFLRYSDTFTDMEVKLPILYTYTIRVKIFLKNLRIAT